MTYSNPTDVRLDMAGTLEGTRYTVRGRVVLTTEVEGETYVWNEYNLQDDSGRYATLVYEETEDGSPWKLFKLFDPPHPLDRTHAASMRVGSKVSVDGRNAEVSLVGQSRVVVCEGTAPDGVEVGDRADYFNADYADKMIVVSWSDNDVEHYEGRSVSPQQVARAFGLVRASPIASLVSVPKSFWSDRFTQITAVVVVAALIALGWLGYRYVKEQRGPSNRLQVAAPSPFTLGQRGTVDGRSYSIGAHAVVEIGRLGQRFQRHEYVLTNTFDDGALLVNGFDGDLQHWLLLRSETAPSDLSPTAAAKFLPTRQVMLGGKTAKIAHLFFSRVVSVEGSSGVDVWPDPAQYGFLARTADGWLVARWSEKGLQLFQGKPIDATQLSSGFGAVPKR